MPAFLSRLLRVSGVLLAGLLSAFTGSAQETGGAYAIFIDKGAFTLSVLDARGLPVETFPVATGEMPGRKRCPGDRKTPEGSFTVSWIQNTRGVLYDYHDGHGRVEAYGPWFIHFDAPGARYVGIHGTCPHRDGRIGTRDSQGCIRLHNDDLLRLIRYVRPGMRIVIVPGPDDLLADAH